MGTKSMIRKALKLWFHSMGVAYLPLTAFLLVPSASANTIRVPLDYPTILAGLDASDQGDTVLVAPGTYGVLETRIIDIGNGGAEVTACGFLKDGVVLKSDSGPLFTTIEVNDQGGGVETVCLIGGLFKSGTTLVEGFTLRGATDVLGIVIGASALVTIRGCRFEDFNTMSVCGGALSIQWSDVRVEDSFFLGCQSACGATAITNVACNMWLLGCHVEDCSGAFSAVQLFGSPFVGGLTLKVKDCVFLHNTAEGNGGGLSTDVSWSTQVIENSVFIGNGGSNGGAMGLLGNGVKSVQNSIFAENQVYVPGGLGGAIDANSGLDISGCTFWGNSQLVTSVGGAAVHGGGMRLERNIFAHHLGTEPVRASFLVPGGGCNDFWDNPAGNLDGVEPYSTDIFLDPLFCDPGIGDWTLTEGSPCLPEGSGNCGLIGALEAGCGTISTEPLSWGRIKGLYR